MSIILPLAVENYLSESGLTDTEILVIKKLLEDNRQTIRSLSNKTGKGNSVIDAALKKLMQRGIVQKEKVNDQPKYTVVDPQAIVSWAEKSLKQHVQTIERQHHGLTEFIESLAADQSHPAIEHFSGTDGIMKAYDKLLENRTELLTYFDPASVSAEDPLQEFRQQYARRRQVHGVFQRVIAPDSPAARRFQSRDDFEYRRTVLVPTPSGPSFEKIITGDVVACVDTHAQEASVIRFPKLAESERMAFERVWGEGVEKEKGRSTENVVAADEAHTVLLRKSFCINAPQKYLLYTLAALLVFWTILFSTGTTGGFFSYLYSFLFGLMPLVSSIIIFPKLRQWGGLRSSIGRGIFCMGLSLLLWGCASLVWSYYNFVYDIPAPYPSLADIGFAPSTFLYGLGVIYFADASGAKHRLKNIYAKIFVVLAPVLILVVSYYFLVIVARGGVLVAPGKSALKTFLDVEGPVGDMLALTIAILISGLSIRHMGNRYAIDIMAMLIGLIVFVVADTVYAYTTTVGTFYNGDFGDLIYTIGIFLLSFGVLGFGRSESITPL